MYIYIFVLYCCTYIQDFGNHSTGSKEMSSHVKISRKYSIKLFCTELCLKRENQIRKYCFRLRDNINKYVRKSEECEHIIMGLCIDSLISDKSSATCKEIFNNFSVQYKIIH